MRYIKFVMAKGENITLPYEKAQQVLSSPQQVVRILDENGNWTGTTINKAHIICTKEDLERLKDQQIISKEFQITEPGEREKRLRVPGGWQTPSARRAMKRLFSKMKDKGLFKDFDSYEDWEKKTYGENLTNENKRVR